MEQNLMFKQIKKTIKDNPRTFLSSIAVALALAALLPTKTKAAEFKWHTDQYSGQESGYVCASSDWGIRDVQMNKVGSLNKGECMKIAHRLHQKSRSHQQGYDLIAVIGGKSGQVRYLLTDETTSNKFTNFWHSCSDGALDAMNKLGAK
jgi:hypothetical protein